MRFRRRISASPGVSGASGILMNHQCRTGANGNGGLAGCVPTADNTVSVDINNEAPADVVVTASVPTPKAKGLVLSPSQWRRHLVIGDGPATEGRVAYNRLRTQVIKRMRQRGWN